MLGGRVPPAGRLGNTFYKFLTEYKASIRTFPKKDQLYCGLYLNGLVWFTAELPFGFY